MSLARKVAQNTIIQFTGKIIGTVLALITVGFMMRYLGTEGFGQYTTIVGFLGTIAIFADLGLYLVVTREISKEKTNQTKFVNNALTIRLVASLLVLFVAPLIALLFPYSNIVILGIIIAIPSFLFTSLNQVLIGIFQKHFRMDRVAIGEVAGRITWLLGIILVVKFDLGLLVMIGAIALSNMLNFALVAIFANKYVKLRLEFDWNYWKKILKIAAPLAISVVFTLIHFKVDTVLLSILKPAEEVGIYGAAYKVLEGLITFASIFAGILLPILSRYAFKNREKFAEVYRRGFDVLVIFLIPLIIGTIFYAKPIMHLFGGGQFDASADVLKILIFAVGAIFLAHLFGNTVVALNQQKRLMWIYFSAAVTAVIFNLILIPTYSYYGAAITTVITEMMVCFGTAIAVYLTAKVGPEFKVFFKSLLASAVMIGAIILIPEFYFLINVAIAALLYFAVLYLFKGFSKQSIMEIISFRKKTN